MQNIIFTKYSTDRDDKFKIRTDILEGEKGRRIVRKAAFSSDAQKHIENIYEIYKALTKHYEGTDIQINECVRRNDALEFSFINGRTLEEVLDEELEKGNIDKVLEYIEKFCQLVRQGAHAGFIRTEEFDQIFGDVSLREEAQYINVANIDMLFVNIIVNDYWNIIDYEWTFLFDIPVDFIIYRAVSKYIDGMLYSCSRNELHNLEIWQRLGMSDEEIEIYKQMEYNFYCYVNGQALTRTEMQQLIGKPVISIKDKLAEYSVECDKRTIQVFFDFGDGFSEENSKLIAPSWKNMEQVDATIQIPENCIMVRIDPMSGYGFFELSGITLDGEAVDYDVNGIALGNQLFSFYSDDPQFIIKNTMDHKEIKISGRVFFTDMCVSDGVIAQNNEVQNEIVGLQTNITDLRKSIVELHESNEKAKVLFEDEISKKNNHIDNLQVRLYQTEQDKVRLEEHCMQLEQELKRNILVRLLKSNKFTHKLGRFIKYFFHNGFRATFHLVVRKFRAKFSKKFYKDALEIKSASATLGDNVFALKEVPEKEGEVKSIAVHLHLFYLDLLPEFVWYLNNIPYSFDLFISCPEGVSTKKIRKTVKRINNVNKIVVKECQNRGRDIAPLYVWFREEIESYDYFLHMHTKKSLYTGTEKIGWRQMSLDSLLGSEEIVQKIFGLMEKNKKIGLVYPEYYIDFCKFHCSWLTNDIIGREFLDKLNIEQDKLMFNYPAGSFFWAKTEAVRPLFDMKLQIEDFPEEQGQVDTTLAHVLERAIACVAEDRGYVGALIDLDEGVLRIRRSLKLFRDYIVYKAENVINELKVYSSISFDIFGTLVANKAYNRTTFFGYIERKHPDVILPEYDFVQARKQAENEAVKQHGDSTKLLDIYECLAKNLNLDLGIAKELAEYENEALIELCIPRQDMQHIYKSMIYRDKEIVLVEDTYYSKETIEKLLEHCGYTSYNDLWISCEHGKRKDKDELWDDFFEKYSMQDQIHVGDNPRSDWQTVYDRGKNAFWVMNGYDEFCMSNLYDENLELVHGNYNDAMKLGELIHETWFNSPFALQGSEGNKLKE